MKTPLFHSGDQPRGEVIGVWRNPKGHSLHEFKHCFLVPWTGVCNVLYSACETSVFLRGHSGSRESLPPQPMPLKVLRMPLLSHHHCQSGKPWSVILEWALMLEDSLVSLNIPNHFPSSLPDPENSWKERGKLNESGKRASHRLLQNSILPLE